MKRDISFEFPDQTITFTDVELPDANTPMPPTNATIHVMSFEKGYGTPEREFIMHCGVRWRANESTGEHKYFYEDDYPSWLQNVSCPRCREICFGETP